MQPAGEAAFISADLVNALCPRVHATIQDILFANGVDILPPPEAVNPNRGPLVAASPRRLDWHSGKVVSLDDALRAVA